MKFASEQTERRERLKTIKPRFAKRSHALPAPPPVHFCTCIHQKNPQCSFGIKKTGVLIEAELQNGNFPDRGSNLCPFVASNNGVIPAALGLNRSPGKP